MKQLIYEGLPWDGSAAQKSSLIRYSGVRDDVDALGYHYYDDWLNDEEKPIGQTYFQWLAAQGQSALECVMYDAWRMGYEEAKEDIT